jgi:hypothetical protein
MERTKLLDEIAHLEALICERTAAHDGRHLALCPRSQNRDAACDVCDDFRVVMEGFHTSAANRRGALRLADLLGRKASIPLRARHRS